MHKDNYTYFSKAVIHYLLIILLFKICMVVYFINLVLNTLICCNF